MKILLVEDEEMLAGIVARGLRKAGYAVDIAYDGEEALVDYEVNEYDLIILDRNLPRVDGMDVLKSIRSTDRKIKVLILSALGKVDDRVEGLDEGADDYLVKPFDFRELEARVRNLLHREFVQVPAILQSGGLKVDTRGKRAFLNDIPMKLTRKEYGILEYLLMHRGKVVSAEELTEHVWDSGFDPFSNTLRYHIHSLKKKLSGSEETQGIRTIRGQGYMIDMCREDTK